MKDQHVFIIGAKGLGNYGGYETFVNKLTEINQNNNKLHFHVACKANGSGYMDETKLPSSQVERIDDLHFVYHNADCFKIKIPNHMGSAQAIYYDLKAFDKSIQFCLLHPEVKNPIFYILACRIGPFLKHYKKEVNKLNGRIFVNPDGHEWLRAKWSKPVRTYWRYSEKGMIKSADLVVCDSINIENYIKETYKVYNPKTIYISYGADIRKSDLSDNDTEFMKWMKSHDLKLENYYLIVGRFVPENNFEIMIREFMKSSSKKDLVLITTKNNEFLKRLDSRLHFSSDQRIKFVGTVYDSQLLKKIRENAYAYLHGHSVGGTNPSLLEAMSSTKLNLLYDVGFNREVGKDAAFYWNKNAGDLKSLIEKVDRLSPETIENYGRKAKERIADAYSWEYIYQQYEQLFLGD